MRYYQIVRESVEHFVANMVHKMPKETVKVPLAAGSISTASTESDGMPGLIPAIQNNVLSSAQPPLPVLPVLPSLDTPSVIHQTTLKEETSFCASTSSQEPTQNSPSQRLHQLCPLCFPLIPPELFKKWGMNSICQFCSLTNPFL